MVGAYSEQRGRSFGNQEAEKTQAPPPPRKLHLYIHMQNFLRMCGCLVYERLGDPGLKVASLGCLALGERPQEFWLPTVFYPRLYCGSQWWGEGQDSRMIPMCGLCVLSSERGESREFSTQIELLAGFAAHCYCWSLEKGLSMNEVWPG